MNRRSFLKSSAGIAAPFILTGNAGLTSIDMHRLAEAPTWEAFQTIARGFSNASDLAGFLGSLNNEKLVETLVLHRELMESEGLEDPVLRRVYMHYVINTPGPIPDENFDIKPWIQQYCELMQMELSWQIFGDRFFTVKRGIETYRPTFSLTEAEAQSNLRNVGRFCNRCKYGRDDVIPASLFHFDPQSSRHSLAQAMWMSEFSSTAYFEPAYIESHVSQWGYDFTWIEKQERAKHDTQCYIASRPDHAIVCFRGTSSFRDLITDAKFIKRNASGYPGKIHTGFREAFEEIWDTLRVQLAGRHAGKRLLVTGHSLGAALAQLAAFRLKEIGYDVQVYLFGSPHVGDKKFSSTYNALLADQTYVHINNLDAVTRIPPLLVGFRDVGRHFFKFNEDHAITYTRERIETDEDGDSRESLFEAAWNAFDRATAYLSPETMPGSGATYTTTFDSGLVDDHGIGQYLFKFACAIVEEKYDALGLT